MTPPSFAIMHRREFVYRSARAAAAFGIVPHIGACRREGSVVSSPFVTLRDYRPGALAAEAAFYHQVQADST